MGVNRRFNAVLHRVSCLGGQVCTPLIKSTDVVIYFLAMAKILIACEYTGLIREAFKEAGHDATSCDLLPTEIPGKHYQGDVMDIINNGWDLLIGHPPCTYISYAATKYWNQPGRAEKRLKALDFFRLLLEAPITHICIENPLGVADHVIRKHDQIIQPYYFGDMEMKRTCLWLKNLPKLQYNLNDDLFSKKTAVDKPKPVYVDKSGKKRYFTDAISGSQNGGHKRSASFPSIAKAMAEQWTPILNAFEKSKAGRQKINYGQVAPASIK